MHQALYRKWRPRNFDEVSGQDHITSILKYECATGHFSHAYLFCGSRGTGKTSCAKILAKAVNCEHPTAAGPCGQCAACRAIDAGSATDVLEMDAASNNGVDDIRDIRDEVIYAPSALKYRVYIIDEVHMLSPSAFNALLKTLEEPPAHVVFILATTELQKLPATIISRCQRFDFRRISIADLSARLHYIAGQEGIDLSDEGARLIARQAQGGMRDAVSLLELCAGSRRPITPELVTETIGTAGRDGVYHVIQAIIARDYDTLFETIDEMVSSSRDPAVFWQELISYYRDMLVTKTTRNPARYLDLTDTEEADLLEAAGQLSKETMLYHIGLLEDALFAMQKSYAVKRTVAEITLVRMCDPALDTSTESILSRLSRIEEQLIVGVPAAPVSPAIPSEPAGSAEAQPAGTPAQMPAETPARSENVPPQTGNQINPTAPKQDPTAPADGMTAPDGKPKRILRPLRPWTEVVERIREADAMAASFYGQAKAYTTEDSHILIKFDNDFSLMMASQNGGPEIMRKALSVCLGRNVTEQEILSETESSQAKEGIPLDLIIEAAEDGVQETEPAE